jgi:signal transduction histidine kinase
VLRVQSVLRRASRAAEPAQPETLTDGDLVVDVARRVARLRGEPLALTVREFDLLTFLMRHPGRAFRRSELLEAVWGWTFGDQSTVTVHMRRLRGEDRGRPGRAETDPHRVGRGLPVRGRRFVRELLAILVIALGGALVVAVLGWIALRLLRHRSIIVHICVLLAITVLSVFAGILAVAGGMFISEHDLQVLLVVLALAGGVSLAVGVWLGRRLAAEAMWADEVRLRERQMEASRRELVAWVSHDLRTPLAGLRAMAEALEDGVVGDPETVADYHRRVRMETDRMASLVDDLFELSRINAGALQLTLNSVSLGDVVSDAVASAAPVAAARGVRLVASDGGWPTVLGSEPELSRVVANLLRNAIRQHATRRHRHAHRWPGR